MSILTCAFDITPLYVFDLAITWLQIIRRLRVITYRWQTKKSWQFRSAED